jgi:hypothetical protein
VAASITDIRYCGAGPRGVGRFRAVVRAHPGSAPGEPLPAPPPAAPGSDDCAAPLGDLAERAAAAPASTVTALELEATWRPWELRLAVVRQAGAELPPSALPALTLSTARIATELGPDQRIAFRAALSFAADGIEARAVIGDAEMSTGSASAGGGGGWGAGAAPGATLTAELPFPFANQILTRVSRPTPLSVRVDRDTTIDVADLAAAGNGAGLTVTALATPRTLRQSARLTVDAVGDDLEVLQVRADPVLEDCGTRPFIDRIACSTRNAGRSAAASTLAGALTQRYQRQLVRTLAGPQDLRFDAGGRTVAVRGDLLRVAPAARGISVTARIAGR